VGRRDGEERRDRRTALSGGGVGDADRGGSRGGEVGAVVEDALD
jgi:hypothetical protein